MYGVNSIEFFNNKSYYRLHVIFLIEVLCQFLFTFSPLLGIPYWNQIFSYSVRVIIGIAYPLSALHQVKQIDFSANNFVFHNCRLISFLLAFHHLHTQILPWRFPFWVSRKNCLTKSWVCIVEKLIFWLSF